jgi:hypothetical protein
VLDDFVLLRHLLDLVFVARSMRSIS